MAKKYYTLEAKQARAKIGGLLRSKKNPYVRHSESYAKKNVEKMRKDIKAITGMNDSEYKSWMKNELAARKSMKMNWSDYDLYLQAKLNKAREVSKAVQERVDSGKFIDTRLYKTINNTNFFSKKSVFTPEVANKAHFSLPQTYEKGIEENGVDNYSQYILLREMKSGQQADTMVYRHKLVNYDDGVKKITPIRTKSDGTTAVVMTKATVFRENYYKALAESLANVGPEGMALFNEIKRELDKLDNFEFEAVAAFVPIPYVYEEIHVRKKYTQVLNELKEEIEYIKRKQNRG